VGPVELSHTAQLSTVTEILKHIPKDDLHAKHFTGNKGKATSREIMYNTIKMNADS
jgi:hypothetical protein